MRSGKGSSAVGLTAYVTKILRQDNLFFKPGPWFWRSILTTGQSSASRKRRQEVAKALQELLSKKNKTPTINYDKLFSDFKGSSDIQITREMYDDALRDLQDGNVITRA